jgi:hypothetical protein
MGNWIKRRIDDEKSKHEGRLDWSLIAEQKIISRIKERINELEIKELLKTTKCIAPNTTSDMIKERVLIQLLGEDYE